MAALSEEREHHLAQRNKECKDPEEKEWIEAAFATESDIPDQMRNVRMALSDLKMRQEDMQDRLNLCISVVINFKPEAMLYKVDFMSESEREELIKDNLGCESNNMQRLTLVYTRIPTCKSRPIN